MQNIRTEYESKTCSISIIRIISTFVNWLPLFLVANIVIIEVYNPNIAHPYASYFGRLSYRDVQIKAFYVCLAYLAMITAFKWKLSKTETDLNQKLNDLKNNLNEKNLLQYIHGLFPKTTRILNGENFGILMIGTCHLSKMSAVQTAEIIKMIKPTDVMLELDEKRAKSLFEHHSIHQYKLIDDLFQFKTWCDPIMLFLRIGSRCISYFAELGDEFKQSVFAVFQLNFECRLIFGDHDAIKTAESVEKATPFWLKIVLNLVIIFGFGGPFLSAFYYVMLDFAECIYYQCYVLVVCKVFISCIAWMAYTLWTKLFIQIWAEESKNSMQRVLKFYSFLGYLVPCLTRALQKSDLKAKRDHILAESTLECIHDDGKKKGDRRKLIVSVTGLAHMDSMHKIATSMIKSGKFVIDPLSAEM